MENDQDFFRVRPYRYGVSTLAPNYGFLFRKVPQVVMDELKKEIDSKLNKGFKNEISYVNQLVGEIKNEYRLQPKSNLVNFLKVCNEEFDKGLDYYQSYFQAKNLWNPELFGGGIPLSMNSDVWVNFQKKHEYNPLHFHKGIISWVIWYHIPYTFQDESSFSAKDPTENRVYHGDFEFIFNHPAFGIQTLPLAADKTIEGHIIMFPANLHHKVNPFHSSDEYRITVAGNFKLQDSKIISRLANASGGIG